MAERDDSDDTVEAQLERLTEELTNSAAELRRQTSELRGQLTEHRLGRLEDWWEGIGQDDRELFLAALDKDPIPAGTVPRLIATFPPLVLGDGFKPGSECHWPQDLYIFLQIKEIEEA